MIILVLIFILYIKRKIKGVYHFIVRLLSYIFSIKINIPLIDDKYIFFDTSTFKAILIQFRDWLIAFTFFASLYDEYIIDFF
jgi:hypothetical protein